MFIRGLQLGDEGNVSIDIIFQKKFSRFAVQCLRFCRLLVSLWAQRLHLDGLSKDKD